MTTALTMTTTLPSRMQTVKAVFQRNFMAYFINPTGYVFITVFILLGAVAAFWQPAFFLSNLANLDTLNAFYPVLLLFFVPALTMNVWSEERRQGTDELLLTLPARDVDVVLGKYLAVLGIYSVAVLFSLSHVIILMFLGKPDLGLMFATYLGYWLSGAALLAAGMVASLLTANATVAFILGAVLCGIIVVFDSAEGVLGGWADGFATRVGLRPHLAPFGAGLIPLGDVLYFVALAGVMLYLNVALVGRRHLRGGEGEANLAFHLSVRTIALVAAGLALHVLADRTGARADATSENLHTLQHETRVIVDAIPDDRPVFIRAFFSPEVPESYVQVHKNLVNTLRQLDRIGGDRLIVSIEDTEPYTPAALEAQENFQIVSAPVLDVTGSQRSAVDIYLGLVFTSGPEEFIVPFFDRGLPVEYELARSIRVVTQTERKKLGVVTTDAQLFGGFDFQTMSSRPDWSFVRELRKQYDLEQVPATGPYPEDLDALLAVLPSSLPQTEMDAFLTEVRTGMPTLIIDDPLPMYDANKAPSMPKDAGRNPFTSQGQPPAEPKGDFDGFLRALGLRWRATSVVWSGFNPHPVIADADPEIVFVVESRSNPHPFNPDSVITSGLQEVVLLYPGSVTADTASAGVSNGTLDVTPLLRSGTISGETDFNQIVQRNFFGMQMNPNPRRVRTDNDYVLALRAKGNPGPIEGASASSINVIFVADVDAVSETFFNLRRQGFSGFQFDNVTFALNCIDTLMGDEDFIALRKHRPRHRTLTRVEALSEKYTEQQRAETTAAEERADEQLAKAQESLNQKVSELQTRTDLDDQTKQIMLRNLENVENRRLDVQEATIEQAKQRAVAKARAEMEMAVNGIQRRIKWWAAVLPPIPTLLLAIGLFARRQQRERLGVSERRMVEGN